MTEERTEVLYGVGNTIKRTLEDFPLIKECLNSCIDKLGPSTLITTEPVRKALVELKERGITVKYITEITKDNIHYCKELMKIVSEMRHLKGVKGNFGVTEFSYVGAATNQEAKPVPQLIVSTVKGFVEQQQYFFDMLWNKSIPSIHRIKEIEEGTSPAFIETLYDPDEIRKVELDLIKRAKEEVLMILPSSSSFYYHQNEGLLQQLKGKANKENVNVRILSNADSDTKLEGQSKYDRSNKVRYHLHYKEKGVADKKEKKNFVIQSMELDQQLDYQQTRLMTIIIDKSISLVFELREDIVEDFWKGVGLAIYSNSKSTVLSYVSTFETIWFQTQLLTQLKDSNKKLELSYKQIASANKQLKVYDRMQREFINIAAHELRTPIQPIVGLSEVLYTSKKHFVGRERLFLEMIIKNADKLLTLTDNILDVTRIENNSLRLRKERFDLYHLAKEIVRDYQQLTQKDILKDKQISKHEKNKPQVPKISLSRSDKKSILVYADRQRISQVISNLIANAIKFTPGGRISIILSMDESHAYVSVSDTGHGIDSTILPRLFTKFVSRSDKGGTGLGLYISKSIVEAHSGKIWALNNGEEERNIVYDNGKVKNTPKRITRTGAVRGATFTFTLPLISAHDSD